MSDLNAMRRLSPRRNTTTAQNVDQLVAEQLAHFAIDPDTDFGKTLARLAAHLYESQADIDELWALTLRTIDGLDRADRIAYFNAKKFLSFQLARLLDTLQNPTRRTYQALDYRYTSRSVKGPYAVFDNVTAIFSATPVIARTATYIYACAEWIEDAFKGRELLLEIYSRLLNPTSVALANFIVDLEAGPYADQYFAWNFNSGMAAIDGVLAHVLGRDDILITSRNIYGGAHQLIHDWYAKDSNLGIAVESFDGDSAAAFEKCLRHVQIAHAARLAADRNIYLYLESPCNPHGYVLDVPAICAAAHAHGIRVMLDATVGTPFLHQPLQRDDPAERPDFVIHSYTKDLSGTGSVIAGCVIGRNEDMFVPKGSPGWEQTMFWNVYYVKGAFLNADAAFEVIQGMKTLEVRMLAKCINTKILAEFLAAHPQINVHCNALPGNANHALCEKLLYLNLPAPLFTIDIDGVTRESFQRFFDSLAPMFGHMISLGQSNTIVSCPALTTHSELDENSLRAAGIAPTTIRFAMGDEDPRDLITHFIATAKLTLDHDTPGFCDKFMTTDAINQLVNETYTDTHRRHIESKPLT
ncbi:MAG: Cys/Met metabolism pyridoxal-phosphate-dependent enzyme [Planctomycetes bacterium]|nr:Cys/Met metabolism pyridoxal-phosphate-dependent enzyme [Planctomycetota bacterium]